MKQSFVKYTCEECGKEEIIEQSTSFAVKIAYVSPVFNWYKVDKYDTDRKHFCSITCLANWTEMIKIFDQTSTRKIK